MNATELAIGDTVEIDVHINGVTIPETGQVIQVNNRWAVLVIKGRSVTAFISQLRKI